MRIGHRLALWKHDREVECILLQRERDALRGYLAACCLLDIRKYGNTMGQNTPIVVIFAHSAERF